MSQMIHSRICISLPLNAHNFIISLCPALTGRTGGRELSEENDPDLREEVLQKSGAEDQVSRQPRKVSTDHSATVPGLEQLQLLCKEAQTSSTHVGSVGQAIVPINCCSN